MSFDLNEVRRLQQLGGPTWAEYQRLVSECDTSTFDSPAHKALGEFQQGWLHDPQSVIAAAEAKAEREGKDI
jgi:hypothetical protein